MRRLSRGVLFCPLHRAKSRAAGKGEANAVSQSPECLSYHMIQKANPVTLSFPLEVAKELDS